MFRREREFNIISGETLAFPCSRSASNIEKVRKFDSLGQLAAKPIERLGYSKDRKQFQYSYASNPVSLKLATEFTSHEQLKQHPSMLNSVSTDYNIVTMRAQHPTSKVVSSQMFAQKLPQVNRRSPLTEHMDAGRLFATNYHDDYPERTANREFFRRKNLCDQTCDNEKTYGFKYFRPLK